MAKLPVPCEVALEACGSAHYLGRYAHALGHTARLKSPQFVLPYVKSNKNDANDADTIVEAAECSSMRSVGVIRSRNRFGIAVADLVVAAYSARCLCENGHRFA